MNKFRYPFKKNPLPEWVEVPFDATKREGGTFEAKLNSLPQEKLGTLRYQLSAATAAYNTVQGKLLESMLLARGETRRLVDDDLIAASRVISQSEEINPAIKRTLLENIYKLQGQRSEAEADPETAKESFLSSLREFAFSGGDFGAAVLSFAEALAISDSANAGQVVAETFESKLADALGALHRARGKIVAYGVAGHRGLVGELVDEEGAPIADEEGKPKEADLPHKAAAWSFNNKARRGTSEETLSYYYDISPNLGLLVSLSEAVLLYQEGRAPTPADIWDSIAPAPPPKPTTTEAKEEAKGGDDDENSDDEVAAPLV